MANRRFIDFPIATTVGDSDIILIWQSGVNKQTTKATFLSGLPENLDELNDVAISGLTNGQILRYDSVTGKWENTDQGNLDLNDLNDVSIVSPSNGQVLVYNSSTSKWENSSGGYVPYTGAVTTVNLGAQTIQAGQFVKAGGTSSQFLKADGSIDSTAYGTGSVTSVGLTMPSAFNVANSPITSAGTLAVTGAGTVGQYIRGDGSLADFPIASGGGSSVSYYLNGSVNQGTIGGVAYKELSKVPVLGTGTDFTINADGYIASFLTDAGDPNLLEIPGGNWNFETYFSASSGGGSPTFYVELYKYNGTTFTLLASNSGSPELIAFGTTLTSYFSTLAVPTTTLALTDRLAIRYYVNHSGRTITLHTEDNHLCQVITTFTTGLTALNGLTAQVQNFAVGTSGTDFNIASATATHTFNLPTASATNRGALSSADWSTFNAKQNALTLTTTGTSGAATLIGSTLNIPNYSPDLSGYVPTSRTITINGTTQDLSANRTFNVGTVTSVGLSSATSGVTIGGSPVTGVGAFTLTIATASGSQQGLLSAADWTTFNNKQNALTNPVTGTGTINYLPKFTGSTTIGNSAIQETSGNIQLDNTSSVYIANSTSSGYFGGLSIRQNGTERARFAANSTDGVYVYSPTFSNGFSILSDTSTFLRLTSGGNLLVGTTTDNGARLQVSGEGRFTSHLRTDGVVQWNGTVGALSYGSGFVTMETNSATQIRLVTNGTTALTLATNQAAAFSSSVAATELYLSTSNGLIGSINSSAANGGYVTWQTSGTTIADLGTAQQVFGTGGNDTFGINGRGARALTFGTNNTERMRITSSGNVGIGTSSPQYLLTIGNAASGFTSAATIASSATGSSVTNLLLQNTSGSETASTGVNLNFSGVSNWLGRINAQFVGGTGLGNADMTFWTPSGGTISERMRITSGGNVGIGTSSIDNAISGTERVLKISNSNVASLYLESIGNKVFANFVGASGSLVWYDITAGQDRMRITSGGNVLIGTTTDVGARLHVNGDVRTAAPTGGSAVNWRLGTVRGGTVTPNATVRVEIGGVLVDLDARYV